MKRNACPNHKGVFLEPAMVAGVEVDYCPRCYGMWFDRGELRLAKDRKDRDFRWLDVDLWKDPAALILSPSGKACPVHGLPLYETRYGTSGIRADVCGIGSGVWLDRGEFKAIIEYVRDRGEHEVLSRYLRNLTEEVWEIFSGPEMLKEEILDVLALAKLLQYKLVARHPALFEGIAALPR